MSSKIYVCIQDNCWPTVTSLGRQIRKRYLLRVDIILWAQDLVNGSLHCVKIKGGHFSGCSLEPGYPTWLVELWIVPCLLTPQLVPLSCTVCMTKCGSTAWPEGIEDQETLQPPTAGGAACVQMRMQVKESQTRLASYFCHDYQWGVLCKLLNFCVSQFPHLKLE